MRGRKGEIEKKKEEEKEKKDEKKNEAIGGGGESRRGKMRNKKRRGGRPVKLTKGRKELEQNKAKQEKKIHKRGKGKGKDADDPKRETRSQTPSVSRDKTQRHLPPLCAASRKMTLLIIKRNHKH